MKISSASKKVLASALSAAMVVAFAPTAAFASAKDAKADGTKTVTIAYDANGGTLGSVKGEVKQLLKDGDKYYVEISDAATATSTAGYAQNSTNKWFIDEDGDGLLGSTEKKSAVDGSATYIEVAADTTAITLKANYTMPTVAFGDYNGSDTYDGATAGEAAKSLAVNITTADKAGHTYVLTVKNPAGTVVGTETFGAETGQTDISKLNDARKVSFTENPVSTDKWAAYSEMLTDGEYTAELTDNGKVISTAKTKLAKVTVKVGDSTKSALVKLDAQGKATVDLTAINALGSDYAAYLDADGYNAGTSVTVKGNTEFTATKVAQAVSGVSYDNGSLKFVLAGSSVNKFAVTVVDPSGATIYSADYTAAGDQSVSFNTSTAGARTTAPEQAGTYVVNVAATTGTGADAKTTESKAKMSLTEIKYAVGEGVDFKTAYAKAEAQHAFTSSETFTEGTEYQTVGTVAEAKDSNASGLAWELNGKAISAKNGIKAGEVNTLTATVKAATYADAPSYTITKQGNSYVLVVTPAANTTVVAKVTPKTGSATTPDVKNAIILDGTELGVELIASATDKTDKKIVLKNALGLVKGWTDATSGGSSKLELTIGNTGSKWMAAEGVKAAVESGKTGFEAVAAKYFADEKEIDAATLAAQKALYEAVAAEADAQVAKYANGADVIADSKVYNMSSAVYAAAQKTVADAEKAVADAAKTGTDAVKANTYATGVNNVISAANTALNTAVENTKIEKADIEAAAAVDAQITKLVADYAEVTKDNYEAAGKAADEAQKAYDALSTDQKKLMTVNPQSIDIVKAEVATVEAQIKAEEAQQEAAQKLADAQDLAAARQLYSKTVTAKAKVGKKAQGKSFTYKLAASESGAVATYSKASGSKYIKVSKSGKVTFSKVKASKKAKTYKAKVTVTYGTQTATKTVTYKVKKK